MKKTEFMDLLKYYFRKEDKADLKGILEDCEEQFRIGIKKGKSEEEICYALGHPRNIYRYYIGKPIIQADNDSLRETDDDSGYDNPPVSRKAPYDWNKDAESQPQPTSRRRSRRDYRDTPASPETGRDFHWDEHDASIPKAAKAVASPFLDIIGTLFGIAASLLYACTALAVLACIGISLLPAYIYTDLLPLPALSFSTMAFSVLAILFAALTASYAKEACHAAARRPSSERRRA